MKKSFMITAKVFLSFYMFSAIGILHAQWQEIIVAPNNQLTLYDIQFVNENSGYVVGRDFVGQPGFTGFFAKTTDGGTTWIEYSLAQSVMYNHYNYKVLFLNENTGFVAGYDVRVFKTTNGGLNWQYSLAPDYGTNTQAYYDMFFLNETTGYLGGRYGILARTTDAGITWDSIPFRFPHGVRGVWFANENTGYVCDQTGYIHKTTDGSATWQPVYIGFLNLSGMSFIDVNTGYVCGSAFQGGAYYRCILKTINGGSTWDTVIELSNIGWGSFENLEFINAQTGYVYGYGPAFKTIDGGDTWIQLSIDTIGNGYLNSYFFNENTGFVSANSGRIYKTETGGVSVQNITTEIPTEFLITKAYPNPFNSQINIEFDVTGSILSSGDGNFFCKVYDVRGVLVKEENFHIRTAGKYSLNLRFEGLNSGVYFINILSNNIITRPQKVILIK